MKLDHGGTARLILAAILICPAGAMGQLAAPNAAGVAMGHLHYYVEDVEASAKFWVALGGVRKDGAAANRIEFPGVVLMLSKGEKRAGTEGSVLNHVAFRVESLAALEARGFEMHYSSTRASRRCSPPRANASSCSTTSWPPTSGSIPPQDARPNNLAATMRPCRLPS